MKRRHGVFFFFDASQQIFEDSRLLPLSSMEELPILLGHSRELDLRPGGHGLGRSGRDADAGAGRGRDIRGRAAAGGRARGGGGGDGAAAGGSQGGLHFRFSGGWELVLTKEKDCCFRLAVFWARGREARKGREKQGGEM